MINLTVLMRKNIALPNNHAPGNFRMHFSVYNRHTTSSLTNDFNTTLSGAK